MATERSRSPMGGSPVPASMFAPEPASHSGAAAASSRPHRDIPDSDCSEDGEVLNGEPELDLTSKVGPVEATRGAGSNWQRRVRRCLIVLSRLPPLQLWESLQHLPPGHG